MLDDEAFQGMRDTVFRRLTGVKKATFLEMQSVLEAAEKQKKVRGGRPSTLPVRERPLMMLEYWREYSDSERPVYTLPGKKDCMRAVESMKSCWLT